MISSCARSCAPSLAMARLTCVFAVKGLIWSCSAISSLVRPPATMTITSRSRSVNSVSRSSARSAISVVSLRNRVLRPRVATGDSRASPRAITRMASWRSSALDPLAEKTTGAGSQRREDVLVDLERREHQHADGRQGLVGGDQPGGGQSVHVGHPHVHEYDVRFHLTRQCHHFLAVRGLPHHLQVGRGVHEYAKARAYEGLVIGQRHPDRPARSAVRGGTAGAASAGRTAGTRTPLCGSAR